MLQVSCLSTLSALSSIVRKSALALALALLPSSLSPTVTQPASVLLTIKRGSGAAWATADDLRARLQALWNQTMGVAVTCRLAGADKFFPAES